MGGEGDSNHLVSGGDLEGDSDFTQPRIQPWRKLSDCPNLHKKLPVHDIGIVCISVVRRAFARVHALRRARARTSRRRDARNARDVYISAFRGRSRYPRGHHRR